MNNKNNVTHNKKSSNIDDFVQYNPNNPFIQYSNSKDIFRCKEHPNLKLVNKGTTMRHSKTSHEIDLEGKNITEKETYARSSAYGTQEIKEQSFETEINSEFSVTREMMKDVTEGAVKITKNPYMKFLYFALKDKIPYDWDFEDFLIHSVEYFTFCGLGVTVEIKQDLNRLTKEEKEWQLLVAEEWKEYRQKMASEA